MNRLDWALLRSFAAVLDTGSLSSAAAQTGSTQPTLSRHIRELETALGVSLFTRSVRGLEPTDAAVALADDARRMDMAADALALKASGHAQELAGTVRVTASMVVANLVLPTIIAACVLKSRIFSSRSLLAIPHRTFFGGMQILPSAWPIHRKMP